MMSLAFRMISCGSPRTTIPDRARRKGCEKVKPGKIELLLKNR